MAQKMTGIVNWQDKLAFTAQSGSGFQVELDGNKEKAASPMELLLIAMGGCSSIDVVMILEKMRENVSDCSCKVEGERAEDDPKVFTKIHAHFDVHGDDLNEAKVARAIELSAEKYCSVSLMLAKAATVTHSFKIHPRKGD